MVRGGLWWVPNGSKACTGIMITAMGAHGGFNQQLGIDKGMDSR